MPELKRIFNAGKMNRDLDDRLVPAGEYREALNINIGRSEGSDVGAVENLLGNSLKANTGIAEGSKVIGALRDNSRERIYFFVTTNNSASGIQPADNADYPYTHQIWEYEQLADTFNLLASGPWLNFWTGARITGINILENLLFWTDDRNEPRRINVDTARDTNTFYDSDDVAAVIKFAPFEAPEVRSIRTSLADGESNFLRDKLPRFSYRYQYEDGEYSVLAPFTPIVFKSYTGDTAPVVGLTEGIPTGDFSNIENIVKDVTLVAPTPAVDVDPGSVTVEFLYKETTNSTIYILGEGISETDSDNNITGFRYTYLSQDPFRALPASQLTRVFDAVPRLAKSQEVAGGRIVYGNFLQDYDIPDTFDYQVSVVNQGNATPNTALPAHSVKSRRTYQVGVVLSDRYGRTSPVLLSASGTDSIFVPAANDNEIQKLRIDFTGGGFPTNFPDWAYSYKIVVKQREQEYYNVFGLSSTLTGGNFTIPRRGDTVNKVPFDSTQTGDFGSGSRPTSVKMYSKFIGGRQSTDDSLYSPVGIDMNGNIEMASVTNAAAGAVAFETEPFISDLDIFFETSTGGLVEPLRTAQTRAQEIEFYNCYIQPISSSAHLEINRIRAGFNEPFFDVGVRAHVVNEDFAGENRRGAALIHSSGLFNSRTSVNQLNQFNASEGGITVSLDPSDGSIQKLFAEDTQLLIWQEDKVSRSPVDKDFIYSAEGGAVPVTSNSQYLGTIAPYAGEYGISQDPDSFAVYGTRKYFTDRNRGVVLRLSQDGLSEISGAGMNDFFRDALRTAETIIGSFDEYHDTYNLTIVGEGYVGNESTNIATVRENAVFNTENPGEPERDIDYFTVSFEEDVKGWNSFKSFKQEFGLTLNNVYYTFSGGNLWEHNTNQTRNNFYGIQYNSQLELIFNDAPSVIKEFKTLATEGNIPWDCEYMETDLERFGGEDEVIESRLVTMNFNFDGMVMVNDEMVPDGAAEHTLPTSSRVTRRVAEGSRQEWPIVFNAARDFRFTSRDQLNFQVGEPAITGTTAFPEREIVGDAYVALIQYEAPAEFSGDNDITLNIDVTGMGPTVDVTGTQYVLTIDHTTGLGIDNAQWLDASGAVLPSDEISISASDFDFTRPTPIASPRSYRLTATRTEDSEGNLDITQDVYYFPYTGDNNDEADAAFITNAIGFPGTDSNDPEVLYTGGVFPFLDQDETTIEFASTTGIGRNDVVVSNVFELPTNPTTGRVDFRGTGVTFLPKYPTNTFSLITGEAATGLLPGPTSGNESVRVTNITLTVNRPVDADTNTVDVAAIELNGAAADLPETYPVEVIHVDPRSTNTTFRLSLTANDQPDFIIPVPPAGQDLPDEWALTPSSNMAVSVTFDRIAHRLDITGTVDTPAEGVDATTSLTINGQPADTRFMMAWDSATSRASGSIISDVTENILGVDISVSRMRVGGAAAATTAGYIVGDVLAQIDITGVNHHIGLIASRFLNQRQGPTAGTIINQDIRVNEGIPFGVSNVADFQKFTSLNMPLGGPRYQSPFDDIAGYRSNNRWFQAPYRVVNGERVYNSDVIGYGWVGTDAANADAANPFANIAWDDIVTYDQSGWRISTTLNPGDTDVTFHRTDTIRAGIDLTGAKIRFTDHPNTYVVTEYRPNAAQTGGTFVLDRGLVGTEVLSNTNMLYNPNPGEHGFQGELRNGASQMSTGAGFYAGDEDNVTLVVPYNPYPFNRVARITAIGTTTNTGEISNYDAIRGEGFDVSDENRNLLITQPGVPTELIITTPPLRTWGFNSVGGETVGMTVPAAVHYANWTGTATDMNGDGTGQLTRVGLPTYTGLPNRTDIDNYLAANPYRNSYPAMTGEPVTGEGRGMPNLWFGFDVDRDVTIDGVTTERGINNSRTRRAAGNTGTLRMESRWDMRTHTGERHQPYVLRCEWTNELVRGGARQNQNQIGNMDFQVDNDVVTDTLVARAGNRVNFELTQLVTNGEIANVHRIEFGAAGVASQTITLNNTNLVQNGAFNQFAVLNDDLHGLVTSNATGLFANVDYQARAWSGICLSRYNRNGNLVDIGTRTTDEARQFGFTHIGNENEGNANADYNQNSRFPHHRTEGIPRYYVGHLPNPEQPQPQGAPEFRIRQVVYFVPMIADENGVTAPYRGGDQATIGAMTNDTFASRTLGEININPSVPPQVSHNTNGDVQIITTNINDLTNDITPPQLIVFVPQEDLADRAAIDHHIAQLELMSDIETVFSDGAGNTGNCGFMRVSAVDFLPEYFDEDGNPQFYPEMNRDNAIWENTGHIGTDAYYLDHYGTTGFAVNKRPT